MRVAVVGAGIVGAAIARGLGDAGLRVTVLDAGMPGQGASARSFGWVNASFFADAAHHRLRAEGIAAWHRAARRWSLPGVAWPGALWWEETGDAFDRMADSLRDLGYPVTLLDGAGVAAREPALAAPPDHALLFPAEGAVDLCRAGQSLLEGVEVLAGLRVRAIATRGGRVRGVVTESGTVPADAVVVAAGCGAPDLLRPLGVALPMLDRPGALMRSAPLPPLVRHVLVAPGQELRQDADGRVLAPTSPSHQGDDSQTLAGRPDDLAAAALARVADLLGRPDIRWHQVVMAMRPVPRDGLPVIGRTGPEGLYVAVMHSGATLAAIVGELASDEIRTGEDAPLLAPYRPDRFAG